MYPFICNIENWQGHRSARQKITVRARLDRGGEVELFAAPAPSTTPVVEYNGTPSTASAPPRVHRPVAASISQYTSTGPASAPPRVHRPLYHP